MKYLLCPHERTIHSVLEDETNALQRLAYPQKLATFEEKVQSCQEQIIDLIARHIGVDAELCHIDDQWYCGGFNLCVPVTINSIKPRKLVFRIPLDYKLGEANNPGNIDEKILTEAATYITIADKCADVPTPELLGFGLTTGCAHSPRGRKIFGSTVTMGYILLTYIENGRPLSDVLGSESTARRQQNLYRDLARINLSLTTITAPTISSLTINPHGEVQATNRPLFLRLQWLENECIQSDIGRNQTYTSTTAYWQDLLKSHYNRLIIQPNSINDEVDGRKQLAALQILKDNMHAAIDGSKDGPYYLRLTDLSPTNIFVDNDWRIVAVIDLEWACFWPSAMLHPPMWLTQCDLTQLVGDIEDDFEFERTAFMEISKSVEIEMFGSNSLSEDMENHWARGSCWTGIILGDTTSAYDLIQAHFIPYFYKSGNFHESFEHESRKWHGDTDALIRQKLEDLDEYRRQIAALAYEK